ncbi:MAG: YajQ family cyclic di-GMP-binding protein [Spirochaetia bacterium]|nr:YajQ family cyclic di-GMP-binding protein [Spirochaetia bacterium]
MAEYSFDVVSKVDRQELNNALDMVRKEIDNRFDFKGAKIVINLEKDAIMLETPDDMKLKQLIDSIQSKLVKRNLSLKAFDFSGKHESNVSGTVKLKIPIQTGLSQEQTKVITKLIKECGVKVQARIQGDAVRVTGKAKDDLQAVQKKIREANLAFDTSYDNYR